MNHIKRFDKFDEQPSMDLSERLKEISDKYSLKSKLESAKDEVVQLPPPTTLEELIGDLKICGDNP